MGSIYHNYKVFFSIILLGVVDAAYQFLWVDVGANGSTSDWAVCNKSSIGKALENNALGLPPEEALEGEKCLTSLLEIMPSP